MFTEADIISVYTRAQAIEDGVLVDVSEMAREAGFKWPVAVTVGVWAMIENIPEKLQGVQDIKGRLWDVVWMASLAVRHLEDDWFTAFDLIMDRNENGRRVRKLKLWMVVEGDVESKPAYTIMLPEEY